MVRLVSLGRDKESSGSFGFAWIRTGVLSGHLGSRGFTRLRLGIVEFIRVRVGSIRRAQ